MLLALVAAALAPRGTADAHPGQEQDGAEKAPAEQQVLAPVEGAPITYFFALEADAAPSELRATVAELGGGARVLFGPGVSETRPQVVFYAVEAPATVSEVELARAMKKGASTVERLRATTLDFAFIDSEGELFGPRSEIPMLRETVIGLAGEMRWCTARRRSLTFYHTSKIDAEELVERAVIELREWSAGLRSVDVHTEAVRWSLALPVPENAARACERKLGRLPFVRAAAIDVEAGVLDLTLIVADLETSGPMAPLAPVEPGKKEEVPEKTDVQLVEQMDLAPVPSVEPLLEVLREAGLALR